MVKRALLAALLMGLASGAEAQPANAPPATRLPSVTVTAPKLGQVPSLVERFGVPDGKGRLARWEEPVCPVVAGLPQGMDRIVEQRIRETARAAKILVADPRCATSYANILVMVTPQPKMLAERLVSRRRSVLQGLSRWPFDRQRGEALVASDDPVRWWYVSDSVPTDGGKAFTQGSAPTFAAAFSPNNLFGPPAIGDVTASRLKPATEEAFSRVIIIVDANRVVGFDLAQISGYVAMVSLAQIQPHAELDGVTSIMNMFADRSDGRAVPGDLTFWDRAYLGGLYDTDAEINFNMQKSHIAEHIRHDVAIHDVIPLSATTPQASGG